MSTWIDTREQQDPQKIADALASYRRHKAAGTGPAARVGEHDTGDERYGLWLALVDARLSRAVGVGLFDLGDWNMRDAYEDGMSPRDAAHETLAQDDTYSALVGGGGFE
jgi:hypothetical protein